MPRNQMLSSYKYPHSHYSAVVDSEMNRLKNIRKSIKEDNEDGFTSSKIMDKEALPPSFGDPPSFSTVMEWKYNESHPTKCIIPSYENITCEKYAGVLTLPDSQQLVITSKPEEVTRDTTSDDPILSTNSEELWKYIMSNLFAPQPLIHMKGLRKREIKRSELDADGNKQIIIDDEIVIDFDFYLDLSQLMDQNCKRLAYIPREGEQPKALQTALEEYSKNNNPLKELLVRKQPLWDWERVAKALNFIVRSTGYSHVVEITFPVDGTRVDAYSSTQLQKIKNSKLLQGISCLSCAWICLLPMYLLSRKRIDCTTRIVADYCIETKPEEFFQKNYWAIFFRVTQGNHGHYKVQV